MEEVAFGLDFEDNREGEQGGWEFRFRDQPEVCLPLSD